MFCSIFQEERTLGTSKTGTWGPVKLVQGKLSYWLFFRCKLKTRSTYECRCDERLKTKSEDSTRLVYTGILGVCVQTAWTEDQFTMTSSAGIRNREKRASDTVARNQKVQTWRVIVHTDSWSVVGMFVDSEIVLSTSYGKTRVFINKTLSTETAYQQDLINRDLLSTRLIRGKVGPGMWCGNCNSTSG